LKKVANYFLLLMIFVPLFLWTRSLFVSDTINLDLTNASGNIYANLRVLSRGGTLRITISKYYPPLSSKSYKFPVWVAEASDSPLSFMDSYPNKFQFGVEQGIRFSDERNVVRDGIGHLRRVQDIDPILFGVHFDAIIVGSQQYFAVKDYWFTPCLLLLLGLIGFRLWVKKKKHEVGYCSSCGYDLRCTPDRCPECGRIPRGD